MEIQGRGTLYKNQYGWSISDNQKQQDGTINKFYIPVRFKKDLEEPQDRSYVSIKGFTKPYKTKEDKLGISYFIMDYEVIGSKEIQKQENVQVDEKKVGINSTTLDELDINDILPF